MEIGVQGLRIDLFPGFACESFLRWSVLDEVSIPTS